MFKPKNTITAMNTTNFGVGSILKLSLTQRWLLIADSNTTQISLLDLETFRVSVHKAPSEDINYISEEEARVIARLTNLNCAFSDFDFDSNGIKFHR